MTKPRIESDRRGIPAAVREGAESADGAVVEIAESSRRQRLGDTPQPAEAAARTVMARTIETRGRERGTDLPSLIQQTAADLVRGVGVVDANIIGTVRGAIVGAMHVRDDVGIGKQDAVKAAAIGALEGAGDSGPAAVERVKKLVTAPIDGVPPMSESMFATGRRTP